MAKQTVVHTTELIRYLARTRGRSQAYYHQALSDLLEGITDQLAYGHRVRLIGFGSFYTREQPASAVKSLQTSRTLVVPARRVAAFRVGELLKRAVRQRPVGRPRKGIVSSIKSALGSLIAARKSRSSRAKTTPRSASGKADR